MWETMQFQVILWRGTRYFFETQLYYLIFDFLFSLLSANAPALFSLIQWFP